MVGWVGAKGGLLRPTAPAASHLAIEEADNSTGWVRSHGHVAMSAHPPVLRSPKGDIVLGVKALDGDSRGRCLALCSAESWVQCFGIFFSASNKMRENAKYRTASPPTDGEDRRRLGPRSHPHVQPMHEPFCSEVASAPRAQTFVVTSPNFTERTSPACYCIEPLYIYGTMSSENPGCSGIPASSALLGFHVPICLRRGRTLSYQPTCSP